MSHICALQAALVFLQTGLALQHARLALGDYEPVPWVAPLYQLAEYIRLGVCARTAILEDAELPDLAPLLAALPLPLRARLEQCIQEERAGQTVHVSLEALELAREVAAPPPLRSTHSA